MTSRRKTPRATGAKDRGRASRFLSAIGSRATWTSSRPWGESAHLRLEKLEDRTLLAGDLVISEFMASNTDTLRDQDGDFEDWIEIHNSTDQSVNLGGWSLTDDATQLDKWKFPAQTLEPGGMLVVFASNKNRAISNHELHTNFKLASEGEFLALVYPDETTIASQFSPNYPRQLDDISYGQGQTVTTLVNDGAVSKTLVPTNGNLGTTWTIPGFNYSTWLTSTTGIGFETGSQVEARAYGNLVGAVGTQEYGGSLGHDFTVNKQIVVTRLGVFDSGANGLQRTLVSQIWSRSGNSGAKLAQLTFTPADPGTLVDSDRYKTLATPLVLPPGEYTIVAYGYGPGEPNGNAGTGGPNAEFKTIDDANDTLSFIGQARYGNGDAFPVNPDDGPFNRYSAGVFQFSAPAYGSLIRTNLAAQMSGLYSSAYLYVPFTVSNVLAFDSLQLRMKYDDGFVAYLNGVEVARRNAPQAVSWNSTALAERPLQSSLAFEDINTTSFLGHVNNGLNRLTIQGLNLSPTDNDFLILPQLLAASAPDGQLKYFDIPTPGQPNNSQNSFPGLVDDLIFNLGAGFYDAPQSVTISTPTAGAVIRYTTDGTAPTATTGLVYSGPIAISQTTTLRAAAFLNDLRPTDVHTNSYLFLEDILNRAGIPAGYPATWGGTAADYAMDQNPAHLPLIAGNAQYTITQARQIIKDSLRSLPTLSIVTSQDNLFGPTNGIYTNTGGRGVAWERPVSAEYLLPDGSEAFQIDAGLRIMGFTSRDPNMTSKHSLRLLFKREYGASRLEYPYFGPDGPDSFNTIALRANARDNWPFTGASTYIRDQYAKIALGDTGQPTTAGNFVHLYLNGMYWGVYNPTERPDAEYAADHFGGDESDYDAIKFCCGTRAVEGNMNIWNQIQGMASSGQLGTTAGYQLVQGNNPDGTRNPALEKLIDIDNLIDYMIAGQYHASGDWPGNYYASRRLGPDSDGFKFFTWDNDLAFSNLDVNANKVGFDGFTENSPGNIDRGLRSNPEYRLRFADHVYKHLFNAGDMTPAAAAQRWRDIADPLRPAMIAESVRWGDHTGPLFTPSANWEPLNTQMYNSYFPNRTAVLLGQLQAQGLYPTVVAPTFNQFGGIIHAPFNLTISAPAGIRYYTLDGSDPRLSGGGVNPTATAYSGPIALDDRVQVKSRVLSGGVWSALAEATFALDVPPALRITELQYNPRPNGDLLADELEFIEIMNVGLMSVSLADFKLTGGVDYTFGNVSLAPSARIVVASNQAAFGAIYGDGVNLAAGAYSGQLADSGEALQFTGLFGQVIQTFTYDDSGAWPDRADGNGSSLEVIDTAGNYNDPQNWRSSSDYAGSPGSAGLGPVTDIVVNEILTNGDDAHLDAIELYNTTASAMDIGGWYLSDSSGEYRKYRIPDGTILPAGSYLVFDESQFNAVPSDLNSFALDGAHGDSVWLLQANAAGDLLRFVDHVSFIAAALDESFGRWPNATGELYPTRSTTLGEANSGPRVGPVSISELMYKPQSANDDLEFIELHNTTSAAIDLGGWQFSKGVTFAFAPGSTIAAGGKLVVLHFDPAAPANAVRLSTFRATYGISDSVPLVGGYTGTLSNNGETVQLVRPDAPPPGEPAFIPLVLIDEVDYTTAAPWPTAPATSGAALARLGYQNYGNDPANWQGATATPGFVAPYVADRRVFYNGSMFDGQNSAADVSDDGAVAPDKVALLPGGTATVANYTSYSRGINGVIVDIVGLAGPLTAADFEFRIGNDNTPGGWAIAAAPQIIDVRPGAGSLGSKRVTLIWPDLAIRNTWLQVRVKATAATGLTADDVFYFGNAVGESGSTSGNAQVNATDELGARANPRTFLDPASLGNVYDFNRDGLVNATDQILARSNSTTLATALKLIRVPGSAQAAAASSPLPYADMRIAAGLIAPSNSAPQRATVIRDESAPQIRASSMDALTGDYRRLPQMPRPLAVRQAALIDQQASLDEQLYELIAADLMASRR